MGRVSFVLIYSVVTLMFGVSVATAVSYLMYGGRPAAYDENRWDCVTVEGGKQHCEHPVLAPAVEANPKMAQGTFWAVLAMFEGVAAVAISLLMWGTTDDSWGVY